MQEEQRQWLRADTRLMDEVQVNAVQGDNEVAKGVQPRLLRPPVIVVTPVIDELFEIRQVGTVLPACTGNVVGPADAGQPGA